MTFVDCPRPPGELKNGLPKLGVLSQPGVLIVGDGHRFCIGNWLKFRFCVTLSMGMSKLGVLVKLNTSKVYFNANRSVIWVNFERELSAFFCHDCPTILRRPDSHL